MHMDFVYLSIYLSLSYHLVTSYQFGYRIGIWFESWIDGLDWIDEHLLGFKIWAFVKSPNLVATGMDLVCLSMYLPLSYHLLPVTDLDKELMFDLEFRLMALVK